MPQTCVGHVFVCPSVVLQLGVVRCFLTPSWYRPCRTRLCAWRHRNGSVFNSSATRKQASRRSPGLQVGKWSIQVSVLATVPWGRQVVWFWCCARCCARSLFLTSMCDVVVVVAGEFANVTYREAANYFFSSFPMKQYYGKVRSCEIPCFLFVFLLVETVPEVVRCAGVGDRGLSLVLCRRKPVRTPTVGAVVGPSLLGCPNSSQTNVRRYNRPRGAVRCCDPRVRHHTSRLTARCAWLC